MNVKTVIANRRAYRSLKPVDITPDLLEQLGQAASLAPSCFNNQPWRFVAVHDKATLAKLHTALSKGNEWAQDASLIIAVATKKELDCVIGKREYHLFDTGMATAFMLLQATELNLVAHPFAGYKPKKVAEILNIPQDMGVIALVAVGYHSSQPSPKLSEAQLKDEKQRPARMPRNQFFFENRYQ